MASDIRLSEWADIPQFGSLVVPNIGADITGNINIESSSSG